ncbi:hypothetical protein JY651_38260 [Pyxidicoccus parkwayensis]|uniref:Uncharacterized protein n=1 Tax=Pyxidicoccus parkwayensis TaxID=2813578 RepID=A0ABX7NUE4_9BACT|nr:B-box zinc finger protein [Pyxidicoccus parkwaysis]QSQ21004.1 hypothetical protein JY651_38260 [Pyxidicoccus parkwaysis]
MAETDFGRGVGALCAIHPERAASRICSRCANFMCEVCSDSGTQAMCPTCRERTGLNARNFPLSRDNWSMGALLETCWEAFTREWVMISVGVLIFFAGSVAGNVVSRALNTVGGLSDHWAINGVFFVAGLILSTVVQGLVTLGLMRMLFDVLEGRRVEVERIFTQFHKAVPLLLTTLLIYALMLPLFVLVIGGMLGALAITGGLDAIRSADWMGVSGGNDPSAELIRVLGTLGPSMGLMVLVGFALYVFPGMWLMMPLTLVQPELARSENPQPLEVLRRCFAYSRGQRLPMVGIFLFGGVLVAAGVCLCCVGAIPAMGLFQLLIAGLYLTLSKGGAEG